MQMITRYKWLQINLIWGTVSGTNYVYIVLAS